MSCIEHKFANKPVDEHYFCVVCDIAKDEENVIRRDAIYSGPGKSGICICGCAWDDHHLGMVARLGRTLTKQGTYEYYIPQECERYGFNECGGMKFNETTEEWEYHCNGYQDRGTL